MSNFDWGQEKEEPPDQIAEALRKVKHESSKRRHRNQALVGSAAAILLIGAFVLGNQVRPDSSDETVNLATQSEAPSTSVPAPGETTTTTAAVKVPAASRPPVLYAAVNENDQKGKIVSIDSQTGKVTKTIVSGASMNGLALTPDRKTLFYTELDKNTVPDYLKVFDLMPTLKSVDLNNGTITTYVYDAFTPKVSPDGTHVAIARLGTSDLSGVAQIVNIATKQVTDLVAYPENPSKAELDNPSGWVSSIVGWTDNTHVSAVLNVFSETDPTSKAPGKRLLHVFDTSKQVSALSIYSTKNPATRFAFPKASEDVQYSAVALPNNQLFVVERNSGQVASRMLLLDGTTGAVKQTVATGFIGRNYGNPATDATGNHLIYMSGNDVRVVDYLGNPVVLASGITSAAW